MEAIMAIAATALVIAGMFTGLIVVAARIIGRPLPEEWMDGKRDPWRALLEKPFILERRPNGNPA